MKRTMLAVITAAFFVGPNAFAAFSVEELHAATALAVNDFGAANPGHVPHLTGYKTWKSGSDAKVKIYVSHDGMNMEFNYVCHKHGDDLECHAN